MLPHRKDVFLEYKDVEFGFKNPLDTELMYACVRLDTDAAKSLIQNGANVNAISNSERSFLMVYIYHMKVTMWKKHDISEMVQFLISHGANPKFHQLPSEWFPRNILWDAVHLGHTPDWTLIDVLIRNGAETVYQPKGHTFYDFSRGEIVYDKPSGEIVKGYFERYKRSYNQLVKFHQIVDGELTRLETRKKDLITEIDFFMMHRDAPKRIMQLRKDKKFLEKKIEERESQAYVRAASFLPLAPILFMPNPIAKLVSLGLTATLVFFAWKSLTKGIPQCLHGTPWENDRKERIQLRISEDAQILKNTISLFFKLPEKMSATYDVDAQNIFHPQ